MGKAAAYFVVAEALTDAAKHSGGGSGLLGMRVRVVNGGCPASRGHRPEPARGQPAFSSASGRVCWVWRTFARR